jgi:aflatoxin B1 aldehyde reductase
VPNIRGSGGVSSISIQGGSTRPGGPQQQAWKGHYAHPELQEAIKTVVNVGDKHGISAQDLALRWLAYHSELGQGDSIVLGASTVQELEDKIGSVSRGPLPRDLVCLLDAVGG